jgi:hypothetical protein
MTATDGYTCACCSELHEGFPAIAFDAPAYWEPDMTGRPGCRLTSDLCEIEGRDFFVRAVLRLPVLDAEQDFEWGVWVSQSERNFRRLQRPWNVVRQHRIEPTFGYVSNDLPGYGETTLEVTSMLHHQRRGWRPLVELEATDHPLAVEQREGITSARVHELTAFLQE